jgi:hypothetical protein
MRALLCLGLLLTWLLAGGVRAQSAAADAEARALFEAGRVAFVDERYGDALASFQRSYDLSGRAELLYNIATCLDRLDREAEALAHFERFLAQRPTAPERDDVERRMVILRDHVARDTTLAAARAEEDARAAEERARQAEAVRMVEEARVAAAERAAVEARAAADADAARIAAAERAAEAARAHAAEVEADARAREAEAARLTEAAHRAVEAAAEGARAAAEAAAAATARAEAASRDAGPDGGAVAAIVVVVLLAAGGGVTAGVLLTQDPGYAPFSSGDVSAMTLVGRF